MFLARKGSRPCRQSGVTLIEALVTFVILSVGLLGIVSLQGGLQERAAPGHPAQQGGNAGQ